MKNKLYQLQTKVIYIWNKNHAETALLKRSSVTFFKSDVYEMEKDISCYLQEVKETDTLLNKAYYLQTTIYSNNQIERKIYFIPTDEKATGIKNKIKNHVK